MLSATRAEGTKEAPALAVLHVQHRTPYPRLLGMGICGRTAWWAAMVYLIDSGTAVLFLGHNEIDASRWARVHGRTSQGGLGTGRIRQMS